MRFQRTERPCLGGGQDRGELGDLRAYPNVDYGRALTDDERNLLVGGIGDQPSDCGHGKQCGEQQEKNTGPTPVNADKPEPKISNRNSQCHGQHCEGRSQRVGMTPYQKWSLLLSALTFVAAATAATIYLGQLRSMRGAVKQSTFANEQSMKQFIMERQPWVAFENLRKEGEFVVFVPDQPPPSRSVAGKIVIGVTNTGSTPAMELHGMGQVAVAPKGQPPPLVYLDDSGAQLDSGIIAPHQKLQIAAPTMFGMSGFFTRDDAERQLDAFVYGYAFYRDRFHVWYCSLFCSRLIPIYGPETETRACDRYNEIYEITSDRPCPPRADS